MAGKAILLVVEDDPALREGLKEILAIEGYTVLAAGHGKEALEKMNAITPDLIISDITMPEMNGYQFFDAVRARSEGVTIPFMFLSARSEPADIMRGKSLGAEDYLVKPIQREDLLAAVQSKLTRFQQIKIAQLEQAYHASLIVLANAIELRDQYTRGHVERVTEYTMSIAEQLGWNGPRLDFLRFGAILHDIGKILIDESIWIKPGPLSPEERAQVRLHPVKGAEMIREIGFLAPALPAILYHHERWDGSGYPHHLIGEAIPEEARIVAIADSFDAMTTTRAYHPATPLEQAYAEIVASADRFYDPLMVGAFRRAWETGKIKEIAAKWHVQQYYT